MAGASRHRLRASPAYSSAEGAAEVKLVAGAATALFRVRVADARMTEAWIQLRCPECGQEWEDDPSDVPEPSDQYRCRDCDARRPLSEFAQTQRDLEIVEEFH